MRKRDGFNGQRAIVLPAKVLKECERSPLISSLFLTDIGFYPKAKFHYREREPGFSQHILIYCVDGKGWLELSERKFFVEPGQCVIIPANARHKYGSDDSNPWSIYWLHFKGLKSVNTVDLISGMGKNFCRALSFSDDRIKLFDEIYNILETGYSDDKLSYINMCLWHFLSSFCHPDIFHSPVENEDIIDKSIRYMQENIERTLTLNELAEQALISVSHYSALFKKKTGYPPLEYFNNIKIQKACQYLQFTNIHIKEVSYKLGINDPYYFSRLFSKVMGQSPFEYRNQKK